MFQKLFLMNLLTASCVLFGMEPIAIDPLSEDEVKTMSLRSFFKDIDAPHEDSWQELSAYKPGGKKD